MTKKQYILILALFCSLILISGALFFVGFLFIETDSAICYTFWVCAGIVFASAIVLMILKHKKLNVYEGKMIREKFKDLDFSFEELAISGSLLAEKIEKNKYSKTAAGIYHKTVTDPDGIDTHYNIALLHLDTIAEASSLIKYCSEKFATYNIGYIFVEEDIEEYLHFFKKYIEDTVVELEIKKRKWHVFFVPILITKTGVYYLKAGSFFSAYKTGLKEGLRILEIKTGNNK